MIHNIAEEREKLHRRESSSSGPFTDEELARLIGQVEEQALIHAPVHLKNNVFSQISAERQRIKRRRLFSYRAKVLVGMAAALAVLFLVPVDRERTEDMPVMESLLKEEGQADGDEWEQEAARRQQEIDRTWERYRKLQRRADVTRQYFQKVTEKMNHTDWED